MNIVVCVKQVPNTTEVKINPETNTLMREGVESIVNPFDSYALEEAIRLEEKHGGSAKALSMGPPQAKAALLEAISLGIDDAYLLCDRAFAGSDTLATSYTLARGIRKIGPCDVILCGRQAIDGDTAQTGPELAECLNFVPVTDVTGILSISHGHLNVRHNIDGGYRDLAVELPALLTVAKDSCVPRMPSIRSIRDSADKPLWIWHAADLGADPEQTGKNGSLTRVIQTFTPEITKTCQTIDGDTGEQVRALRQLIGASLP